MTTEDIHHYYPIMEKEHDIECWSDYLKRSELEEKKRDELKEDPEFQASYHLFKHGVYLNYLTSRRIKHGTKKYYELQREFNEWERIKDINYQEERERTKQKNIMTNLTNMEIKCRNINKDSVISQINQLNDWNEYVEFKGVKYGLPSVLNNIHRENNCNGIMEPCRYQLRTNHIGRILYKCNKCEYICW